MRKKADNSFHSSTRPSWARKDFIGKGSYGTVSLAVSRLGDGRVFAVKSVDKNSCSPVQLQALENEISILRSLSSPYVVAYSGDDVTVEQPDSSSSSSSTAVFRNLHLEYLPGGTAADAANDEQTVRGYTRCVASALNYVHSMGIVHCDVKGKNVLVGPAPGFAKLTDFGSARRVSAPSPDKKILPRGSPLWMAPEVVRGESQGFESDVWSLGCAVIEMMTGKPAWEDQGADTLCRIGYSTQSPVLPSRLSDLGRDFLEKCLRREPSQRWSCEKLLQHPFLSSPEAPATQTPRSVLHWSKLDVSEEDEEEGEAWDHPFEHTIERGISWAEAEERIGELATASGVNWESDGWVEVRRRGGARVVGTGINGGSGGEGEEGGRRGEEWEADSRVGGCHSHSHGGEHSQLLFLFSKLLFVALLCSAKSRNNAISNKMEMKSVLWYILWLPFSSSFFARDTKPCIGFISQRVSFPLLCVAYRAGRCLIAGMVWCRFMLPNRLTPSCTLEGKRRRPRG